MKFALRLAVAGTAAAAVTVAGLSVTSAAASSSTPTAAQHQQGHARLLTAEQRKQLRSTGHVHGVRHTRKHGDVAFDLRAGTATVTPNGLSVLSKDGSSGIFRTDAATKVRSHKQPTTVHSGDRVLVIATADGHARRVVVRRPATASS